MALWHLVLRGMVGRKRDTRLLLTVITLCFLFITLSSTVLSSIQLSQQNQRIARHGRFQVAAFEVAENDLPLYQKAPGQQATSLMLGRDEQAGAIGTMDEALYQMGSFTLLEGRLPVEADEVLLTRAALAALPGNLKTGDSLRLVMQLTHVGDRAWLDLSEQLNPYSNRNSQAAGVFSQIVEDYVKKGISPQETLDFAAWYHAYYAAYNPDRQDFDDLDTETYQRLLLMWMLSQYGPFAFEPQITNRREPFHLGDITLSLHYNRAQMKLLGPNWGERRGETIDFGGMYQQLMVAREYRIVGVLASYTDQWVSEDYALPEAFLSPVGADQIKQAVALAEDAHPDLPRYQPTSLVLQNDPNQTADQVYQQTFAQTGDRREPEYHILNYQKDSSGNSSRGSFVGINQDTGQEEEVHFAMSMDILNIFRPEGVYKAPEHLLSQGGLRLPGLDPMPLLPLMEGTASDLPGQPLLKNTLSYPSLKDAGGTLAQMMPGLLAVITTAAVLQVFLSQLRRRTRRLALLKALGADNRQTAMMLLMEATLLLLIALPLGVVLGLGLSYLAVYLLDVLQGPGSVTWQVPLLPMLYSLLLGSLALFAGVMSPMVQSARIPLMGAFEGASKTPPRLGQGKTMVTLSYAAVIRRNAKANPGRSLLGLGLAVLILLSPLVSLFLGYHAFFNYRSQVVDKQRPDYVLTAPYGMNPRVLREQAERLQAAAPGLARIDPWLSGRHVGLVADGLVNGQSPILSHLFTQPDAPFDTGEIGDENNPQTALLYFTDLWALQEDSPLFERLLSQLALGSVDREAYQQGKQAILLVPGYQFDDGQLLTSTRVQDKGQFFQDEGIKPGDVVGLATEVIAIKGDSRSRQTQVTQVDIAGIVHFMELPGIWPLSDQSKSHILVGSPRLLGQVYPQAQNRMTADQARWFRLASQVFFPYNYGQTFFMAYAGEDAQRESDDIVLLQAAKADSLDFYDYRSANLALQSAAFHNALLTGILGCAVFCISFVIMGAAIKSALTQERRRFGILQSLGITGKAMVWGQAGYGLVLGLVATLLANLLLFALVVIITATGLPPGVNLFKQLVHSTLRGYPWLWHLAICLAFVALSTQMHAWPMGAIVRRSAISNILDNE